MWRLAFVIPISAVTSDTGPLGTGGTRRLELPACCHSSVAEQPRIARNGVRSALASRPVSSAPRTATGHVFFPEFPSVCFGPETPTWPGGLRGLGTGP